MPYPYDWATAPLLFGASYEDAAIELEAFRRGSRVFAIAASGETAQLLAEAGHRVTAVDVNPTQVQYACARMAGAARIRGRVERMLSLGRAFIPAAGWSRERIGEFLSMEETGAQVEYWDRVLDTRRFRMALDALLLFRFAFARHLTDSLPAAFGAVVRCRLRRCWGNHPNRQNPFARLLLLGDAEDTRRTDGVELVCADAAEYLESRPAGSFDGFALSNILDGAPAAYCARLRSAVRRAASAGAVIVIRSLSEPRTGVRENLAERDRSPLWGVVQVCGAEERWIPCSTC